MNKSWPASLDRRILEGIKKMGFSEPLPIQSAVLQEALEGRDCLVQAPTGSGKSLAYLIPMIQSLLKVFDASDRRRPVSGLSGIVLVPSKDLALQTASVLNALTVKAFTAVISDSYTGGKYRRHELPSVLVTTPALLLSLLADRSISVISDLRFLAIDEADVIFSFGFEADLRRIVGNHLPTNFQCLLVSATLSTDVRTLAGLCLHSPKEISDPSALSPSAATPKQLRQYFQVVRSFEDKLLTLFGLIRLEILSGKVLVFVDSVNDAYRLKLVFHQFGLASLVLHSELPASVRLEVAAAFNQGVVSLLFLADDSGQSGVGDGREKGSSEPLHRGIDFQDVAVVVNFDAPLEAAVYKHRIGRTARANKEGISITFVDEVGVFSEEKMEKLPLELAEFEGLRYRVEDVLKSAGNQKKVKTARQREIFQQILTSNKLKNTLTENEEDARALRRAVKVNAVKTAAHLKHLPSYLIPAEIKAMAGALGEGETTEAAGFNHPVVKAAKEAAIRGMEISGTSEPVGVNVNSGLGKTFERKNFGNKPTSLREKLIARNEGKAADADDLPPISGRKLWKIKHKKALKKPRVEAGKHLRSKQAQRIKKIANRFK